MNDPTTNDSPKRPQVTLTWDNAGPTLTVDGIDLTHTVLAGSVKIEIPAHAGTGKPIIRFALPVDDFRVDGDGVREGAGDE
ncbi:hypothetical protein [Nocardioides pakistanensis]